MESSRQKSWEVLWAPPRGVGRSHSELNILLLLLPGLCARRDPKGICSRPQNQHAKLLNSARAAEFGRFRPISAAAGVACKKKMGEDRFRWHAQSMHESNARRRA